jgi:hypothetical protein
MQKMDPQTLEQKIGQLETAITRLSQDPLLKDIPSDATILELEQFVAQTQGHAIHITVDRGPLEAVHVLVHRHATIAQLKQLVRSAIERQLRKTTRRRINWTCIWRQHCLALGTQRLLDERARLHDLGIVDGARLRFIRYVPPPKPVETQRKKSTTRKSSMKF